MKKGDILRIIIRRRQFCGVVKQSLIKSAIFQEALVLFVVGRMQVEVNATERSVGFRLAEDDGGLAV